MASEIRGVPDSSFDESLLLAVFVIVRESKTLTARAMPGQRPET